MVKTNFQSEVINITRWGASCIANNDQQRRHHVTESQSADF